MTPVAGIGDTATDRLFRVAGTAYSFTNEAVSDEAIHEIYALARMAPTAMNAQPLRMLAVRGPGKERLLPHVAPGNQAKAASAPVVVVLAHDLDFHLHLPALQPHNPGASAAFAEAGRRHEFARTQAMLQAGYVILAARAVGLDVGPMGGFDAAGVDAEFLTGTSWRSFMLLNLGRVADDGRRPRSPRLDASEALAFA
jgi:3-hydroxypropanoate dehydrogenase